MALYFCYHTLQGERSLPHLLSVENTIEAKSKELAHLQEERAALEERVVMLRPQSLNADFLEERARVVLGVSRADETIIVQN